jgi:hypothetical protein
MIDALIKRVSVTYKYYEMYAHRGEKVQCSCFEIDQEMDAILLIIGIVYGVCRIVIKSKGKYFTLSSLSYHFSPYENENYHRFIVSLQANNLTLHSIHLNIVTKNTHTNKRKNKIKSINSSRIFIDVCPPSYI